MRIRVDVEPDAPNLRWEDVHGPARGVAYGLLREHDAELARSLHEKGWAGSRLKPLGVSAPQFRGAPHRSGVYTTSPDGSVWFGSPVPEIAAALVTSLASRTELVWGRTRLTVRGFSVDMNPVRGGRVELETLTPVVVKDNRRNLLPGDDRYLERLEHNLAHKADALGYAPPRSLQLLKAGARRRFTVRGAPRIGARVRVAMDAEAAFVEALRSWGLGLDTLQGFGWIQ